MQMGGGPQPLKKAVEAWDGEKPNYHGEKIPQGNFSGYGHYTQVSQLAARSGSSEPHQEQHIPRFLFQSRMAAMINTMLGDLISGCSDS